MKTVAFHTLGCKVNQYDSQAMLELFEQAGYQPGDFDQPCDVYVINTCTVTGTGDKKSLQAVRRARRLNPAADIIVCGCMAQRDGEKLLADTDARLILGTARRAEIVTLLEQAQREHTRLCAVTDVRRAAFEPLLITHQEGRTRATLKIQEGCDRFCTYCIIPYVRGGIRSRSVQDVRDEAARLAQAGYREIVLTGIHLTSYGRDLKNGDTLLSVIRAVHDIAGVERIRLGSLEPVIATADFARALGEMPKLCPQFHLALQSGCDSVLRRMRRRYDTAAFRESAQAPARGVSRLRADHRCDERLPRRDRRGAPAVAGFLPRDALCAHARVPLQRARGHGGGHDARSRAAAYPRGARAGADRPGRGHGGGLSPRAAGHGAARAV